jgi:biotin-dependent carboxylase-like uncharacterized protein
MLTILDPGLLTTVQDLGRYGYERYGVPVSGAMDVFAIMAANRLVGNPMQAAGLEALADGARVRMEMDCCVAAAGVGFVLEVDGCTFPLWQAVLAPEGSQVRLAGNGGCWGYLAVSGGIDVPLVMGSRATCLRAGFGGWKGRALQKGDQIPVGRSGLNIPPEFLAGRCLSPTWRPSYSQEALVEVIQGPQIDTFTEKSVQMLLDNVYVVATESDRMGYRLSGAKLEHCGRADILSEGVPLGAMQVAGDGQPLVLLAERQTTGGYAKIGVVARVDLPALVQCLPGSGKVRFRFTTVESAQARWRALLQGLEVGVEE